jgi:hypothetical protein
MLFYCNANLKGTDLPKTLGTDNHRLPNRLPKKKRMGGVTGFIWLRTGTKSFVYTVITFISRGIVGFENVLHCVELVYLIKHSP